MPVFIFLFLLLLAAYLLLIDYYHQAWVRLPEFKGDRAGKGPFFSVVIAARNEEENLPRLLNALEAQSYPAAFFEVIVIDDHSTDRSWEWLQQYVCSRIRLRTARLADLPQGQDGSQAYKKRAIEAGIGLAEGDWIVTTDADCVPPSGWLETLAAYCQSPLDPVMVAMPVSMQAGRSLLSVFQALDFLTLQGITAAAVSKKFHAMCNGANLAYRKEAFREAGGFAGIDGIPSGDDMLLMHKIQLRYPGRIHFLKSRQVIMPTQPEETWERFWQQRIRWASKADRYQDKKIFYVLLMVYLLNLCFLVLGVAAFFPGPWRFFLVLLLLAKTMIEFPFVQAVARFFNQHRLMRYFPFLQPLHILYTLAAGFLGTFGSYRWKGRIIKK